MRDDDDEASDGSGGTPLAEGLGEIIGSGGHSSASDPYGDGDLGTDVDDSYDDDTTVATAPDDDTTVVTTPEDDGGTVTETDGTTPDDGTFGDGDPVGPDVDVGIDDTGQVDEVDPGAVDDADGTTAGADDAGILAESSSPLEGIGYILDELHGALFGEDEAGAADDVVNAALSQDPVDLETETDLDLTGDGVVDPDDLHEAGSPFDFGVDAHGS
ncbi:MAG TPA: hypothetical protein VFH36_05510 [Acidimicrobiales bacterium]|jgi:hypothetical protein|nr:hypothetical protein [Acidimicrobiales bacterium]